MANVLIYGANGYTGKLIVDEVLKHGIKPTLAGRNGAALKRLSTEKDCEYKAFTLNDSSELIKTLEVHDIVIHCAGPFIHTAKQMAEACIKTSTHYLDITGEYQVFEQLKKMSDQAIKSNVMLLPGAGFDVVPSDCLAAFLKSKLPEANKLTLAFTGLGTKLSRGTAKTMVENAHSGQWFREEGQLKARPGGKSVKVINYGDFEQISVGIAWGDISTAFHSTGIPNIQVFIGSYEKQISQMKKLSKFSFLLRLRLSKTFSKSK